MISNRNDIFRCLIIGSCLIIFWGVIIIWIASYQNLCHALYLTLYFTKYSGVTIIWNSTRSMPWDVPTNQNMSSNWHQRVYTIQSIYKAMLSLKKPEWFKKRFCRFFWPCFPAPTVQQQPLCGVSTGSDHSCRHSVTSKTLEHRMCLCSSAQYSEEPLPLSGK